MGAILQHCQLCPNTVALPEINLNCLSYLFLDYLLTCSVFCCALIEIILTCFVKMVIL